MATIEKRESSNGKITYRAKIRLKGHPVVTATFPRKTDAKKWIQDTESAIRENRYFKTAEARKHTLAELIDRYIKSDLPKKSPKMIRDQTTQLNWWKDWAGHITLADVSQSLVAELRDELLTNREPATVCRYMAALSHAFGVAVNEWQWLESSPMSKVKKPTEPQGRVRYLTDEEFRALVQACKQSSAPCLYVIVMMALCTGMRQGEIMNLTWPVINLDEGYLILDQTKNGERRRVPLSDKLVTLLLDYKKVVRIHTNMLFPNNPKKAGQYKPIEFTKSWKAALEKAAITDFRFHDLRHTAASYLAMNGATPSEIAEVLGHKTLNMVKRYAHLSESHTSSVVQSMNDKMFNKGL